MNIDVYCLCWNEIKIIPFVIDYWKRFARHVYVYDNGSDDGSIELLESYDWITVRHFDSEGFDDLTNLSIKNNCWKGSDADWVMVCDMDEILWIDDYTNLNSMTETIIKPLGTQILFDNFPNYNGYLLHENKDAKFANDFKWFNKCIFFKPKEITDINYDAGCHLCNPKGNVKYYNGFHLLHLKWLSKEYVLDRYRAYSNRLSALNIKYNLGMQYKRSDNEIISEYDNFMNNAREKFNEYYK